MRLYAFDVDHTLWLSAGPVTLPMLVQLREEGHIVGLCGNWAAVTLQLRGWHTLFSFLGPIGCSKAEFLSQLSAYIRGCDDYVIVGNDPPDFPGQSVSDDKGAAMSAGWHFIPERVFAASRRPTTAEIT